MTACEMDQPQWSWGSLARQGMVFQRKMKILGFVLLAREAEWLGSVGFPCSSLQACRSLLYKHQHIVFQRGRVFVKIPICLGSLCLWEAAGLKIWEALAAKEATWHCFCVCPWSSPLAVGGEAGPGSLQRSCQHHLLPFAFWQLSWIIVNYFYTHQETLFTNTSAKEPSKWLSEALWFLGCLLSG